MVLSQCQPPFPRVVSCNVFIYHYRRPKFFFLFQFVLSKAAGFRQRSTAFPQWWSSSSKAELDVKSFWSGEEEEGGESHCAKNLSCVVSCEIMYRRRFVMVQVSNCCFRATVSAKLMMYLIFSESPSFPLLPSVKQTVFHIGKHLKCSIYGNMYRWAPKFAWMRGISRNKLD